MCTRLVTSAFRQDLRNQRSTGGKKRDTEEEDDGESRGHKEKEEEDKMGMVKKIVQKFLDNPMTFHN